MELTPSNSPKYGIQDIKKQNAVWRKRVKDHAKTLTSEGLREYIRQTQDVIDATDKTWVAQTEKARLGILNAVLEQRGRIE